MQKISFIKTKKASLTQFLELLLSLIQSGFTVSSALDVLCGEESTAFYAERILKKIERSENFCIALCSVSKKFRSYETIISSAEVTGDITPALQNMVEELKDEEEAKKNFIVMSIYPAFMILFALVLSVFLIVYAVPFIKEIADVKESSLIKGIIWANIWLSVSTALMIFLMNVLSKRYDFQYEIFRTLYYLCLNKIGLEEAVLVLMKKNKFKEKDMKVLSKFLSGLRSGKSFNEICRESKRFDVYTTALLSVAQNSGDSGTAFRKIFENYGKKKKTLREGVQRIIEPSLIAVTGVYILILIISCVVPVFMSLGTKII